MIPVPPQESFWKRVPRRGWEMYRSWRPRTQIVIGVIVGLLVISLVTAPLRTDKRATGSLRLALTTTSTVGATSSTVATPSPAALTTAVGLPAGDDARVSRHVDGDTFDVEGGKAVRLIGVDTPETVDPRQPVQCFGKEASDFTARLLPLGTTVRLVYDVDRSDGFGRTLAYVYRVEDGLFVNAELVRQGYAQLLTVPPNVAKVEELRALQAEARSGNRGLWSACPVPTTTASSTTVAPTTAAPTTATTATTTQAPTTTRASRCDPSYPDVCIPPPPPDLNCPDIPYRNFRVLSPDPHRFDGDHDGVGCET